MKRSLVLILTAGLAAAAAPPPAPTAQGDREKLQGTWVLHSLQAGNAVIDLEDQGGRPPVATLVVRGERYTFKMAGGGLKMAFKLDPGRRPRAIDMTVLEGPGRGKTYHGIYELNGNTFRVCRPNDPDQARPAAFITRDDSNVVIVTWKRAKP